MNNILLGIGFILLVAQIITNRFFYKIPETISIILYIISILLMVIGLYLGRKNG